MGFRRGVDGDYHGEDANLAVADWVVLAPTSAASMWQAFRIYGAPKDGPMFDTLEAAILWIHMEAANGGG